MIIKTRSLIDRKKLKTAILRLRAIDHELRKDIIDYLDDVGRASVTEIHLRFRLEQSVTSQHLAILRRSEVVETARNGKEIYYSVNHKMLVQINAAVDEFNKPLSH